MKLFLSAVLFSLLYNNLYPNEIKEKCEKVIAEYFGAGVNFKYGEFIIPATEKLKVERFVGQKFFSDKLIFWKIYKADSLVSIGLLDNVYGKSLPITFFVLYNLNGEILKADIIKYRESHGGSVSNMNWLAQFAGLDKLSKFELNSQIQGISGATISSKSLIHGIHKLTLIQATILKNDGNTALSSE